MEGERYIVIDCDVGVDDAWALMILVKAEKLFKNFKIIGITTVFGNTNVTSSTKNAIRVLDSLDRPDIPIFRGCSSGILPSEHIRTLYFHGADGFGDLEYANDVDMSRIEKTHAVNAMYELACKYPKKVSFLLLGPLTNFATCSTMYEDFLDNVKDIWIMGGNIKGKGNETPNAEFNFFYDPEAAHIVLKNAKTPITILPWETCLDGDLGLTLDWRLNVVGAVKSKPMELMNRVERAVFIPNGFPRWIICDAILVAAFLFPQKVIQKSRQYHATIELHGKYTRGQMVLDHLRENKTNVSIIEEVQKDNYKTIILWTAGVPEVEIEWKSFV